MNEGYAICLNEWALDQDIKNELGLLLIISSLTAEKGYCYASNEYFSKLFDIEQETISRKLKKLERKGYITINYTRRGCEVKTRYIRLTKISIHDCQKNQSTIDQKVKENIISIKNTSNNKRKYIKESEKIIARLNELNGTHYRADADDTLEKISARINEGYTEEDLLLVVDKMSYLWNREPAKNEKDMRAYIRPSTLFRKSNFENYYNMPVHKRNTINDSVTNDEFLDYIKRR